MINLPISNTMKNYYREHNLIFTDFEQATIVWIADLDWSEKITMLKEIADSTTDEALKLQINDRVEFEQQMLSQFKVNGGCYRYHAMDTECCFDTFEQGFTYGKSNDAARITIEKVLTATDEFIAGYCWSEHGIDFYYRYEDDACSEETHGRFERFEESFIPFAFPFERGDIVRYIPTGDAGVLETSREDWERRVQRYYSENALSVYDTEVVVDFVNRHDELTCDLMRLSDLELVTEFVSHEEEALMRCMSGILRGEEMLGQITIELDQYVNSRRRKKNGSNE